MALLRCWFNLARFSSPASTSSNLQVSYTGVHPIRMNANVLFLSRTEVPMFRNSLAANALAAVLGLSITPTFAQFPQPDGGNLERGTLPAHWLSQQPKCMEIPEWQGHEYNPNFLILRQSPCTDYEKPFIFLLFGKDKAMLVDTGSRNGDLTPTLQLTIKNWLMRNGRTSIPLIVTHTHEHEDHTWGDKA